MRRHHEVSSQIAGFTLIEVIVALAIAALGLALLMVASGDGTRNARTADAYIEAAQRAQSRLAQVGIVLPLKQSSYSGDDGNGFRWRVRIGPPLTQAASSQEGAKMMGLFSVDVTISWNEYGQDRSMTLHSERLGPT